jgi:uncharacterized repeat protein (TIGR03806 family)
MKSLVILSFAAVFTIAAFRKDELPERKETLSEFGFFKGKLSDLIPVEGVIGYTVNTPLFSNYAEKLRFIKIPDGERAFYNDSVNFDFPVGTILIKNFYYPLDFRKPEKGRRILETRLLVNGASGWEAWPYLWNDEQTEAFYDPAGEIKTISYVNSSGKKITTSYAIPNRNQCKGCHIRGNAMKPIGLSARQMNGDYPYPEGRKNQLQFWKEKGMLSGVQDLTAAPKLAAWNDASTDLNLRARAYLDANCGHCHNRLGPASTSGLFLDINEKDPGHLGVNKSPVAAGRGAGNLQFDIVPGQPNHSILVFRMKTNDPAIAMPEIGREQVDQEGVALIEEWIKKNSF